MLSVKRLLRLLAPVSFAAIAALALIPHTASAQTGSADNFAIKNGDRIVFYGDSITDQRQYTLLTEYYIVTRFPKRDIRFVHSGWGGDTVRGGGGGPIDLRLDRDVTAYKPSVVTIMLGMNDGAYRAYDENIFQAYANGYKHLAEKLKKDNPGVRLTFIQPSPYDDVTRAVGFEGGYNAVLSRYGAYLTGLASAEGASVADLNKPVVAMLEKANATDANTAQKIIPDRVHPGWGGHLIMAESLLKSWNAPSLVSSVTIDANGNTAQAQNATVAGLKKDAAGTVSWSATEGALPFPILPPEFWNADPYNLALKSSDFVDALDQETLTVSNLPAANYTLKIDGKEIGNFTKEQLASGINLATMNTPMLQQAMVVATLTRQRADLHNTRWRDIQVPLANDKSAQPLLSAQLKGIDSAENELVKARRIAATPSTHWFSLAPKP